MVAGILGRGLFWEAVSMGISRQVGQGSLFGLFLKSEVLSSSEEVFST